MTSNSIATAVALFAVGVAGATKCPLRKVGTVNAQAAAFDVASVKPNTAGVRQSMTMNPGGIAYTSVSLIDCLQVAYGVKRSQISGPGWLATERYDINARTGDTASNEQIKAMLQTLIAERFKLSLHREKKELPVFAILVGKNGPRLKAGDASGGRRIGPADGGVAFTNTSMEDLADFLQQPLSRPVFDMTHLTGRFDFTIRLTDKKGDDGTDAPKLAVRDSEPSVFMDALDDLGLKLDSRRAAIDMLVVDRAEKVPTED